MKRHSLPRRRGETLEQFKLQKDRETSLSQGPGRQLNFTYAQRKGRSYVQGDTGEQCTAIDSAKNKQKEDDVFTRDRLKAIIQKEEHEIRKRFRTTSNGDGLNSSELNMKLTFHEWLYKKELEEKERKKREEFRKMELEELEKVKKQKSKRAVDEWMIRTKYRAYTKYFPNIGDDNVNKALLDYMKSSTSR